MGEWWDSWLNDLTLESISEIGTLVLAGVALIISLLVAYYTVRAERRMAKMATYERIHEQLVSLQAASGRRALFLHGDDSNFPLPRSESHSQVCSCGGDPDLWDIINQSLALYDTLATYYLHREVPRKVVLDAWYHPLIAIRPHVYRFLDHRARQNIEQPWAALQILVDATLWYKCKCRVCSQGKRPPAQRQPSGYTCKCKMCSERERAYPAMETSRPWSRGRAISSLRSKFGKGALPWAGLLESTQEPEPSASGSPSSPDLVVHDRTSDEA